MEVLLDTNFILSCLEKRIDFLGDLIGMGFKVTVPKEVVEELKDLKKNSKLSGRKRQIVDVALGIVSDKRAGKVGFGGQRVDAGLIAKGKEGVYIATLDNGVKREVSNKVVIDNSRKGLRIERS